MHSGGFEAGECRGKPLLGGIAGKGRNHYDGTDQLSLQVDGYGGRQNAKSCRDPRRLLHNH